MDNNPIKGAEENVMFETTPEETPPGADAFSMQAQKDKFLSGATEEGPKQPENQGNIDPRQEIEDLNDKLRSHFRGHWEKGSPEDPAERKRILDQEFTEYSDKTGFPVEDKKRLEYLQADYAKTDSFKIKGHVATWTMTHQPQIQERHALRNAERAAIETKIAPRGKAA